MSTSSTSSKTTAKDAAPVVAEPAIVAVEGVTETLAAADEGQVVLRHPTTFGVYQTVPAADVDRWSAQGWLRLK